jgi:hypothetical protein
MLEGTVKAGRMSRLADMGIGIARLVSATR